MKDNAISPLQKQLDILKAQEEKIKNAREEEEKLLAVEKARIALENAQKERTVREYNAASSQWEWVANAQTVAEAQESLKNAERELSDYYRSRSISALENNIKTIQSSYNELRSAIKTFAKAIADGTKSYSEAMRELTSSVSASVVSVATQAANKISASTSAVSSSAASGSKASANRYTTDSSGRIFDQSGKIVGDYASGYFPSDYTPVFDGGGILRGIGGIKATQKDEMILPPTITKNLLNAEANGAFDALLDHLGIVTAAGQGYAGFGDSFTQNRIGTQNNGDTYQFGNVTISEEQARGMTIYDLAQMARTLPLHNVM